MKTIVLSPYTTNDTSEKVANRTAHHLRRHGLIPVVEKHTGNQTRNTVQNYKADLLVYFNIGPVEGGGIGLYCNAKGFTLAVEVVKQLGAIEKPHENRQPALHALALAPCPALMLNDHRPKVDADQMGRQLAKGILDFYGIDWIKTVRKKAAEQVEKGA